MPDHQCQILLLRQSYQFFTLLGSAGTPEAELGARFVGLEGMPVIGFGEIRWLAAEGLIHIGNKAVKPLLRALIEHPDSLWLREGAHHVLYDLPESSNFRQSTKPVLVALEDVQPSLEVAFAAEAALEIAQLEAEAPAAEAPVEPTESNEQE